MQRLLAVLALFRQGNVIANAAAWKNRQITVTALGAFLLALFHVLKAFGVEIPIDEETTNTIAAGVLCIVNIVLTYFTTDKIGLPNKPNDVSVQPKNGVEVERGVQQEYVSNTEPIQALDSTNSRS